MTQVLETMMERQRLEMHKKLNEMFKTYFDARTEDFDIDPEEQMGEEVEEPAEEPVEEPEDHGQNEDDVEDDEDEEDAELIE